jgi:hypothetical protein
MVTELDDALSTGLSDLGESWTMHLGLLEGSAIAKGFLQYALENRSITLRVNC